MFLRPALPQELLAALSWAQNHDEAAKAIARQGQDFVAKWVASVRVSASPPQPARTASRDHASLDRFPAAAARRYLTPRAINCYWDLLLRELPSVMCVEALSCTSALCTSLATPLLIILDAGYRRS